MPCLLVLLALVAPRVVAVVLWLFTTFLEPAFAGRALLLVAGIVFLPFTTLAYAWIVRSGSGFENAGSLVLIVLAVLADLSSLAGSRRRRA
jgi:hypothetical protein